MSGVWPFGSLMICVGSRVGALDNPRLANLKKVAVAEASGMGVRNLSAGKLGGAVSRSGNCHGDDLDARTPRPFPNMSNTALTMDGLRAGRVHEVLQHD